MIFSFPQGGFRINAACMISMLCALLTMSMFAQSADPQLSAITLENALKRTLSNNPELVVFAFKSASLEGESKTANLRSEMSIGVEIENVLGTGEVSGVKDTELTLTLSSVIELGDKRNARLNVVNTKKGQLLSQRRIRTLDILGEATRRYINVIVQQELYKAEQRAEMLARTMYQTVSERVKAGASAPLEQKRAESALSQARLSLLISEQKLDEYKRDLAIMWGDTKAEFTQVIGELLEFPNSLPFERVLMELQSNPHILLYAENYRVQEARLRVAQSSKQFDVTWEAGIRRLQGIDETAFVGSISVPLFTQQRNLGEYELQRALLEGIESQKQARVRELSRQLNRVISAKDQALLTVKTLQESIIPTLESALKLAQEGYESGRYNYIEWVTTQQQLLEMRHSLIKAAGLVHLRSADIEALTGLSVFKKSTLHPAKTAQPSELIENK
jgi:cobalt-zinc-cadmium efflux system outer membrane protein